MSHAALESIPQSPADPVLVVRGLDYSFKEQHNRHKPVLFDVNFAIYPGEFVLLTGPSGCGKTTLLTLIGGLRSVQSGELTVLGQALHLCTPEDLVEVRRQIGFVFQAHNLLKFLTGRQNVQMALQLNPSLTAAEIVDRADQMLEEVGLGPWSNSLPDRLSGGQKQRVSVARALAGRPRLILADEPTASLDSQTGRAVVELLRRLALDQHCPILMVSHDTRIADVADRVVAMEDGRIVSQ